MRIKREGSGGSGGRGGGGNSDDNDKRPFSNSVSPISLTNITSGCRETPAADDPVVDAVVDIKGGSIKKPFEAEVTAESDLIGDRGRLNANDTSTSSSTATTTTSTSFSTDGRKSSGYDSGAPYLWSLFFMRCDLHFNLYEGKV